jgi:hypothetical protein
VTSLLALKSRNLEFDSQKGNEVFAFFKNILNDCGVHADSYSVAILGFPPWVKRPSREADHSPSFNFQVRNA